MIEKSYKLSYPDLPIIAAKKEICAALEENQVIIVAGETGSGKSTQLAKICLEAGYGQKGKIGHTQPRRIAAQSVASRVAQECQCALGDMVGYKIRFQDKTSRATVIKILTDGMMLSETQTDRLLSQYEVIIVDEAHERSLNIDILLGLIKKILRKRPDLKVIVTSATMQLEKFTKFFDAPLIEVPGRQYPVTSHFKQPTDLEEESNPDQIDLTDDIVRTVQTIVKQGLGDILIFQSGEREIHETIELLSGLKLKQTTILPLFARLSGQKQQAIFKPLTGRKIIVATNVAETSITVPNIKYVIDTGYHKVNRYNYKTKLHRLDIEPISQANHTQRKGRCGRIGPGQYYALYEEEDLCNRPLYTDPEILRTSLAKVILQLLSFNVRDISHFPFIDPPNRKNIQDGMRLLTQLGAIDGQQRLTKIGYQMARLPIEPRLARALIASQSFRCSAELLIIVSGLSISDPRERPQDKKEQARQKHEIFLDKQSEFMSLLLLWRFLNEQKKALSHKKFVALCRKQYLSYVRVCEWFDLHDELKQIANQLQFTVSQKKSSYRCIHQSILTGFLDHIGLKQENKQYLGARGLKFVVHPGCSIKKTSQWLVCAELFHTSKTYASVLAEIEPAWLVSLSKHLSKVTYLEPHFEVASQSVVADEKTTLFGLVIQRKKVFYDTKDPIRARSIFIQQALIEQQLACDLPFYQQQKKIIATLENIAQKSRYRHVLFRDDILYEHYDKSIPMNISSKRALENWLKHSPEGISEIDLSLFIDEKDLAEIERHYPNTWTIDGISLAIQYAYEPGEIIDGATLKVPLSVLPFLVSHDNSWPIEGWLNDRLSEDIKPIVRQYKHRLPPLKQLVTEIYQKMRYRQEPYELSLKNILAQHYKIILADKQLKEWATIRAPYLNWHYEIISQDHILAVGDDCQLIYQQLKKKGLVKETVSSKEPEDIKASHYTQWTFSDLPQSCKKKIHNRSVIVYPAIVDEGDKVSISYFNSLEHATKVHTMGLIRLIYHDLSKEVKYLNKQISMKGNLQISFDEVFENRDQLRQAVMQAAIFACFLYDKPTIRKRAEFEKRIQDEKVSLTKYHQQFYVMLQQALALRTKIKRTLASFPKKLDYQKSLNDIEQQLNHLFAPSFMLYAGLKWFQRYPIYCQTILIRLEKLPSHLQLDIKSLQEVAQVQRAVDKFIALQSSQRDHTIDVPISQMSQKFNDLYWQIEELRVSLYAQKLRTLLPVSKKRILQQLK